jgi:hypothetical protein
MRCCSVVLAALALTCCCCCCCCLLLLLLARGCRLRQVLEVDEAPPSSSFVRMLDCVPRLRSGRAPHPELSHRSAQARADHVVSRPAASAVDRNLPSRAHRPGLPGQHHQSGELMMLSRVYVCVRFFLSRDAGSLGGHRWAHYSRATPTRRQAAPTRLSNKVPTAERHGPAASLSGLVRNQQQPPSFVGSIKCT